MIGNFPAVLNFNRLFLKLNRFICNLLPVLPDHCRKPLIALAPSLLFWLAPTPGLRATDHGAVEFRDVDVWLRVVESMTVCVEFRAIWRNISRSELMSWSDVYGVGKIPSDLRAHISHHSHTALKGWQFLSLPSIIQTLPQRPGRLSRVIFDQECRMLKVGHQVACSHRMIFVEGLKVNRGWIIPYGMWEVGVEISHALYEPRRKNAIKW